MINNMTVDDLVIQGAMLLFYFAQVLASASGDWDHVATSTNLR